MGVDGSNSGNFTEVSNMIANMEQNKQLFETITSRATFARHHRKPQTSNSTENLETRTTSNNLYENLLETKGENIIGRKSSNSSWTVEEIPLSSRQSKNLMETLNETQLNLTVIVQDESDDAIIRSESVKSDESITILNELYDENSISETENYSNRMNENKRTPIQSSTSKKLKFDALIPNSIKNMFLSTKRSQPSNSLYEEEKPKKNTKNRKSPSLRNEGDSNSSTSSPIATPNVLDSIDNNENIISNWISIFENLQKSQKEGNDSTSTSKNGSIITVSSPPNTTTIDNSNNTQFCMNGKEFIDLIRMSYQNLCKSNLVTLDGKVLYAFVSTLITMNLMVESSTTIVSNDENSIRLSLASNLCRNETLFETLNLTLYPERIKQEKEKVFDASLQFLKHQVTCQPPCAQIFNSQTNNSTASSNFNDRNEQELNIDKNMLLQRRESKLLLSFEEFLTVNNQCKMGSSLSHEDLKKMHHKQQQQTWQSPIQQQT
ncbi:predicted protein [Naegleria gruberi]|uniref:Predicted protein n=1 Tax=Naegleria gruberi TaxID=5762 RepID=D2W071_NAEGR|nr:uncharacterized protein NAEGRDRAFT_74754 [Naegleria gruberi]EFC37521.1 predicted protein [Naegleria gruberi]|eukprot:XP_002670265.1 predicted protein [Naegleria gruberi strain NEG-M]